MNYGVATERVVTAFFDNKADADEAVERLVANGIPRSAVNITAGSAPGSVRDTKTDDDKSFWEILKDFFLPEEDRHTYAEGLRRGGCLVTARVDASRYEQAIDILDDEGTINIDDRASTWRASDWSAPRSETTIPVVEEHLKVSKRDTSHGRVRVRSYVVEEPTQKQVTLSEEHVEVARRAVDRPASNKEDLFRERTIVAEERAQEPVVTKEARVKEEIVLNKKIEQRQETVADTVRRTKVKIEDDRKDASTDRR